MKALLLLALFAAPALAVEAEEVVAPDAPARDFGVYLEARGSRLVGAPDGFEPGTGFAVGFVYFVHDFLAVTQRYAQDVRDYEKNPAKGRLRTLRLELEARSYLDVADEGALFAALSPGWTTSKLDMEDDATDLVVSGGSVGLAVGYEHEIAELCNVGVLARYTHAKKDGDVTGAATELGLFTSVLTY